IGWAALAAFIGGGGLGDLIFDGLNLYEPSLILAGTIPATIMAVIADRAFALLENKMTAEGLKDSENAAEYCRCERMTRKSYKCTTSLLVVFLLTGCALPGLAGTSKNTIKISSLTQSESETMANLLAIMIERETDADTELVTKLGSSIVQHQGMVQGDIDISSTRYTGTDIAGALDMDPVKDPDEALDVVKKEFKEQFDQTWAETYGFENS